MRERRSEAEDLGRLQEALAGTQPRFVTVAIVDDDPEARDVTSAGVWLDASLKATGEPVRILWTQKLLPGGRGGVWIPPPGPGDEVLAVCVDGDPLEAYGLEVLYSSEADPSGAKPWELPASVVAEPDAVHIFGASGRVLVSTSSDLIAAAGGKAALTAPLVELGAEGLLPVDGLVHGSGIDSFTGATFWALGSTSAVVRCKK